MNEQEEYLRLLRLLRSELERATELGASLPEELDIFSVEVTDADRELAGKLRQDVLSGCQRTPTEQAVLAGAGAGFDRKNKDHADPDDPFVEARAELRKRRRQGKENNTDGTRRKENDP